MGNKLIAELGLDRSCETLSKWLIHLLAEKIIAAETADTSEAKKNCEDQAVELILRIWRQRYALPGNTHPFSKLEKVIEYLAMLADREEEQDRAFLARSDNDPWENLLLEIEAFKDRTSPHVALSQVAVDANDCLLEWEKEHRDMLDEMEISGMELIRRWLKVLDEEPGGDPIPPFASSQRLMKVVAIIEANLRQLTNAVEAFKTQAVKTE